MNSFEEYLSHSLDSYPSGTIKEAALYSLMNGGKRMRPKLLFATLSAYHMNEDRGYAAACAIEMMHTYSLIHDDLPAMDNDTLRRGKPTCHIQYGEANAILAGDALLTTSFEMVANATKDTHTNNKLTLALAKAGGLQGMIYGQELDITNENNPSITNEKLQEIHYYKTGKLITLPLVMASYIAGHEDDAPIWTSIGERLGLLFQIQDDVFDVTKTSEELGKHPNSDEANHKTTYVTLLGIEKCETLINELYEEALGLLDQMLIDPTPMKVIFEELKNRNN